MTFEEKIKQSFDEYEYDLLHLPVQNIPEEKLNNWMEALESGDYKQGNTGDLYCRESNDFCCLGVYLHICENMNLEDINNCQYPSEFKDFEKGGKFESYFLVDVKKSSMDLESVLAYMNDGGISTERYTFEEIAKCIEISLKNFKENENIKAG